MQSYKDYLEKLCKAKSHAVLTKENYSSIKAEKNFNLSLRLTKIILDADMNSSVGLSNSQATFTYDRGHPQNLDNTPTDIITRIANFESDDISKLLNFWKNKYENYLKILFKEQDLAKKTVFFAIISKTLDIETLELAIELCEVNIVDYLYDESDAAILIPLLQKHIISQLHKLPKDGESLVLKNFIKYSGDLQSLSNAIEIFNKKFPKCIDFNYLIKLFEENPNLSIEKKQLLIKKLDFSYSENDLLKIDIIGFAKQLGLSNDVEKLHGIDENIKKTLLRLAIFSSDKFWPIYQTLPNSQIKEKALLSKVKLMFCKSNNPNSKITINANLFVDIIKITNDLIYKLNDSLDKSYANHKIKNLQSSPKLYTEQLQVIENIIKIRNGRVQNIDIMNYMHMLDEIKNNINTLIILDKSKSKPKSHGLLIAEALMMATVVFYLVYALVNALKPKKSELEKVCEQQIKRLTMFVQPKQDTKQFTQKPVLV